MRRIACLAFAVALIAPSGSYAVTPDRTVEVGAAPSFTFEGVDTTATNVSTEAGEPVCSKTPAAYCDYTLIKVTAAGTMTILFEMDSDTTDVDPSLYESNENADQGKLLKDGTGGAGAPETIGLEAEPGYYLVVAAYYATQESGFVAKGTFEAAVPDTGTGGTPTPPGEGANKAPEATITKLGAKARSRSLKGFAGSAQDPDGTVARVEVALVRRQGSRCSQLTANGGFAKLAKCEPTRFLRARGTTKWSLRLRKRLAKGSYVLYVRAVDNAGTTQAGFSRSNRRAFKVV